MTDQYLIVSLFYLLSVREVQSAYDWPAERVSMVGLTYVPRRRCTEQQETAVAQLVAVHPSLTKVKLNKARCDRYLHPAHRGCGGAQG